jgi:hypothetical protein
MAEHRSALDNVIDRLFHYQSYKPEFLENTIRNGLVRFARASEFNDPWDCKPSFFVPDDAGEVRRLVEFMESASERHTPDVDPAYRKARTEHYLSNPEQLRRDLAEASAEMWAQMDRRYRLYCLTTGHYADHHRGVCLEFNARTADFCSAIEVNYSGEYPQFSLADGNDLSPFHSKSSDWSYEQEYRLIAQETDEALCSGTLMTRNGFYQLSEGSLVSVIVGACAPESTWREIEEIARPTGILLRKALRVPHRYELNINPPL